jgi:hypothetical protein
MPTATTKEVKKDVAARIANNASETLTDVGADQRRPVDSVGRDAQFINNLRIVGLW